MQYAVILTGLVAATSAFQFPKLKQLEQRQVTAVSTGPSTTILTTVTTCPTSSTVTSGGVTFVRTGNVTRTITTTVCPSSTRAPTTRASATGFPISRNATAFFPTARVTGTAPVPVQTNTAVLQQQINNFLNIKNTLSLQQQQQQFQQLTASIQNFASLTQQQQSFFTSQSQQLFGNVQTISSGAKASTLAPGEVFVSGSKTLVNAPTNAPVVPGTPSAPGIASFKGAASKSTVSTGSAIVFAIVMALGI